MIRLRFPSILKNRNFSLFFSGQSISMIGDAFQQIALIFLVLELGGGGIELATAQICLFAPRIISLLWGGVLTDRLNIKHILWISDLVKFVVIAILVILMASQTLTFSLLYFIFLISGAASGVSYPAFNSIIPFIVKRKDVEKANTWVQSISQTALVVGPPLGGVLVGLWGVIIGFIINALTYLVAVVTALMIRVKTKDSKKKSESHIGKQLLHGFTFIWKVRWLFVLLLIDTIVAMAIIGPIQIALPLYVEDVLHLTSDQLGIVMASFGLGSVIGMIIVPYIKQRFKTLKFFFILEGLQGLFFAAIAIHFLGTILAVLFIIGVCHGVTNVVLITKIHANIPEHMLGRTMSFVSLSSFGAVPVSQLLTGLLVDIYPYSFIFIGASLIMVIASVVGFVVSRQRKYDVEQRTNHTT